MKKLALVAMVPFAFMAGLLVKDAVQYNQTYQASPPQAEQHVITKTITKPGKVSQACKEEIRRSREVTEQTRLVGRLTAAGEPIQDDAFKAIVDRDWAALNEVKQRQINMMNKLDVERIKLVEMNDRLKKVEGSC